MLPYRVAKSPSALVLMLLAPSLLWAHRGPTAPGPIRLFVDASQVSRRILHAKLVIPVHPGPLTLFYPKWLPADHSPDGPIWNVAGITFSVEGKEIPWQQDLVDMYAFNLAVPQGATSIQASLDFLTSAPRPWIDFSASGGANLFVLMWNQVLLYPKGSAAPDLIFDPSLTLPKGWKFATSLPVAGQFGETISFGPVALDLLVDSPVQSGEFMRVFPLNPGGNPPQELDVLSDEPWALEVPPELIEHFKRLVAEASALYQSHHFRDYHFLLTLSDNIMELGQEHHESSDDRVSQRTLTDPGARLQFAGLFPHEFSHSWNGQYRRPEGLATPDFQQPMRGDLLWVYEGLTEYLGTILTARSGLLTPGQSRDRIALIASTLAHRPGRLWRSLQNTANAAQILYFSVPEWSSYRRHTDFYPEAVLIWLEVDTTIRKLTGDRKSMNDFCRSFYGGSGNQPIIKTYTFDDLISTLNGIAPHDWKSFFRTRLDSVRPNVPLGGVEGGGWRLVYNEDPNQILSAEEQVSESGDFISSIGLRVKRDGSVIDSIPGMPAFESGVSPYSRLVGVNGRDFSVDELKRSIQDSKANATPINLNVSNAGKLESHEIDYHGGSQFPHLERVNDTLDYLGEILTPLVPAVTN